jgi:hypothetical protein
MATKTFGTAHYYGLGTQAAIAATIMAQDLKRSFNNKDTTVGETGLTIEDRMDDRKISGTIRLRLEVSVAVPAMGDTITLAGLVDTDFNVTYSIIEKGLTLAGKAYLEFTLTIENYEAISYGNATSNFVN